MKNQLINEVFGGASPILFAFWMLIAGVSQYMTVYFKSRRKYRTSRNTPVDFSHRFMTQDNLQKFVVGFFIAYFGLRGSTIFFQDVASFGIALGIGPGAELIASFFAGKEAKARE